MTTLNLVLGRLLDGLLYPFRGLPALVGLVLVSLVTAVLMLLVFRATSNQPRLAAVKRRIHACLFEIRLFNDDLRAIFRAQLEILRHNLTYFRLSLVPLVFMIVPFVFGIAHLNAFYGYRGLSAGDEALLTVRFDRDATAGVRESSSRPNAALTVPDGLSTRGRAIWIPSLQEMTWRLTAGREGDYEAVLTLDGQTFGKRIRVSDEVVPLAPIRPSRGSFCQIADPEEPVRRGAGIASALGLWCQLLHPAEAPIDAGAPVASIRVSYPAASVGAFGFATHWIVAYIVLATVFAFALRNRLGVVL